VKGFLRSYSQLLGVDGEALVDEYRRRIESALPDGGLSPLREPPLEHRRRPTMHEQRAVARRRLLTGGLAALLVGGALVAILVAGGSDDSGKRRGHHRHGGHHAARGHPGHAAAPGGTVTLGLTARTDVEVCLVRGNGEAQIDSQTLTAGSTAGPFNPPADRYRLDLDSGGSLQLALNGRELRVASKRAASYEITPGGVRPIDYTGRKCP
jgi:hypothetical protein